MCTTTFILVPRVKFNWVIFGQRIKNATGLIPGTALMETVESCTKKNKFYVTAEKE